MPTTFSTTFDKVNSKLLNWLRKSLSKDDARPTLQNIFVKNGQVFACDGMRIHAIPTPEPLKEHIGQLLTPVGKSTSPDRLEAFVTVEDVTYPDVNQVYPIGQPVFKIGVNPKFLIDALSGFEGYVSLSFYGPHVPILVKSTHSDNPDQNALVMPVFLNDEGFTD